MLPSILTTMVEQGLTSHQTHRSEGSLVSRIRFQSHQVHPTTLQYYNIYAVENKKTDYSQINTNLHTVKWAQCDKTQSREVLNCSHLCVYHCAQLSYTTQHRAVLIIFPISLQTSITAQICLLKGRGIYFSNKPCTKISLKIHFIRLYSNSHAVKISCFSNPMSDILLTH